MGTQGCVSGRFLFFSFFALRMLAPECEIGFVEGNAARHADSWRRAWCEKINGGGFVGPGAQPSSIDNGNFCRRIAAGNYRQRRVGGAHSGHSFMPR